MRRYLPARLLAKDFIISVLSKIKGPGVLPVVNDTSPGIPAFITLDEALALGEVKRRKNSSREGSYFGCFANHERKQEEGGRATGYCASSSVSKNPPSWHVVTKA